MEHLTFNKTLPYIKSQWIYWILVSSNEIIIFFPCLNICCTQKKFMIQIYIIYASSDGFKTFIPIKK